MARRMVKPLNIPSPPLFPLRVIHLDDGHTEQLDDLVEVGNYLEFYSSDNPSDASEMLVLDRENHPVRIDVHALAVIRCELQDKIPMDAATIKRLMEEARARQEAMKRGRFTNRLVNWLRRKLPPR